MEDCALGVRIEDAFWLVEISWILGPALGGKSAHPPSGCL